MSSLKAFTRKIDKLTDETEIRLYERVRGLVRIGVLRAVKGRGPGSGTPLTASNLSALIISMLVTDTLIDIDDRITRLCEATPSPGPACPFTGATNFRDALASIMASSKRAKLTLSLTVDREQLQPEILFRRKRKAVWSRFKPRQKKSRYAFISATVTLNSDALLTLARLLEQELAEHEE